MKVILAVIAVAVLALIPLAGVGAANLHYLFGVVIPYIAIAIFLIGFVAKIFSWAKSPVPFRITTTCGQQKSHDWIRNNGLENPHNLWTTLGRMFLEVFFFRSLFRNTKMELKEGPRIVYGPSKWLWGAGLAFHYAFLVIFIRHFKYFAEPTPSIIATVQELDGFFQVGVPVLYLTDVALVGAVTFLLVRRLWDPKLRYFSLFNDYFPLALIFTIAATGICIRYFSKVDIIGVKHLATHLISFQAVDSATIAGIDSIFYIHLFLVCILFAYFPFSKLMHLGGVFLSPTRNLANNNRVKRHINPWNPDVKKHTYDEYEDEFRDLMKAAGMPLEKEKE